MGEEINEGVKLKPRVMAGNNLVARSELFSLPHPLVLFVGPLLDESGGLETEMGGRRERGKKYEGNFATSATTTPK